MANDYRDRMLEAIADYDDELLMKYVDGIGNFARRN